MSHDEAMLVVNRLIVSVLPALELEATPPFVYQLLLCASVRFGGEAATLLSGQLLRLRVLRGVMDFFDGLDLELESMCDGEVMELSQQRHVSQRPCPVPARATAAASKVLLAVEGTVILHINSSVKHDPQLSKDLVR